MISVVLRLINWHSYFFTKSYPDCMLDDIARQDSICYNIFVASNPLGLDAGIWRRL